MTRLKRTSTRLFGVSVGLLLWVSTTSASELKPETVAAWNRYVRLTEARLDRERLSVPTQPSPRGAIPVVSVSPPGPGGEAIDVPSGMIHHWRGEVFIPGVTVDALLDALKHPGVWPERQQDVLESRILGRTEDSLRVFLKLVRQKIVTVTYNTEHDMVFRRLSPTVATSRSVATKIAEVEAAGTALERERPAGNDRGFMWRLNSYWRYRQTGDGVLVELESLTLSRDIPAIIRPIADPIVRSVARESMHRTLDAMRRRFVLTAARDRHVGDRRSPGL